MSRVLLAALVLVPLGCTLPPERLPLKPLPEEGGPLPYAELVTRARLQASAATEAFYIDKWWDLEDAARGLEQTARFLAKATDVPPKHKETLAAEAGDLGKEATKLREAAKNHQAEQVNEILQQINLKIRQLRPET